MPIAETSPNTVAAIISLLLYYFFAKRVIQIAYPLHTEVVGKLQHIQTNAVGKERDHGQAEVQGMSLKKLQQEIHAYTEALEENRKRINAIKEDAKSLTAKELFGAKGEAIKEKLVEMKLERQQLRKRYLIYEAKLKEFGDELKENPAA